MIDLKGIKKAISILLSVAMLFGFAAVPVNAGDIFKFKSDMSRILQSGYYIVDGTFSFYGDSENVNGLEIAEGATVCIEITEGSALTAIGMNARGTTGAGAGIFVPESSILQPMRVS